MFIRKKKVKPIVWAVTGMMIFAASATMTCAYFTSTDQTVTNRFTPGTVRGELKETDWGEGSGEHMLPGESRKKNPSVRNVGTLDAWIFLEVEIPMKKIVLIDSESNRKLPEKKTELFTFQANKSWELVTRTEEENKVRYIYGYKKLTAPLQETDCLFDAITAVPYLEGSLDDNEILPIPVTTKVIQKNIAPEGTALKEIYKIFLEHQVAERSTEA